MAFLENLKFTTVHCGLTKKKSVCKHKRYHETWPQLPKGAIFVPTSITIFLKMFFLAAMKICFYRKQLFTLPKCLATTYWTFGSYFSGMASKETYFLRKLLKLDKNWSCILIGILGNFTFGGQLFYIIARFGCTKLYGHKNAIKIKRIRPFWEVLKILKMLKYPNFEGFSSFLAKKGI